MVERAHQLSRGERPEDAYEMCPVDPESDLAGPGASDFKSQACCLHSVCPWADCSELVFLPVM